MKAWGFLFAVFFSTAFAGSVTLINDSQYPLKAFVQAANGSYIGQEVLKPGVTNEWTNDYEFSPEEEDPSSSQTPYSVSWTCMDGNEFSSLSNVPEGGMVTAMQGVGPRVCSGSKKNQPQFPQAPETILPQPGASEE